MPAYEYECKDCNRDFTVYLSLREYEQKPVVTCPHCGSDNVFKKLSRFYAKTTSKS